MMERKGTSAPQLYDEGFLTLNESHVVLPPNPNPSPIQPCISLSFLFPFLFFFNETVDKLLPASPRFLVSFLFFISFSYDLLPFLNKTDEGGKSVSQVKKKKEGRKRKRAETRVKPR